MGEYETPETPDQLTKTEKILFEFMKDGRQYTRDRLRMVLGHDEYNHVSALWVLVKRMRDKLVGLGYDIVCTRRPKDKPEFRTLYRLVKLVGPPVVCEEDPGWGRFAPDGSPRTVPGSTVRERSG